MKNRNKINILSILKKNKRVNNYTKLLILLCQLDYYNDRYIPNKKLSNFLNTNFDKVRNLLHQLEEDKIIELLYVKKKRYFKFLINKEKEDIFDYDWLNDED